MLSGFLVRTPITSSITPPAEPSVETITIKRGVRRAATRTAAAMIPAILRRALEPRHGAILATSRSSGSNRIGAVSRARAAASRIGSTKGRITTSASQMMSSMAISIIT